MDQDGLGDFLRRRRAALGPDDVGLAAGTRRRTPGLRREEVASLAHVSTDFYTRLEQGRGSRPSAATTGALARALRLTPVQRDHLYELAGHVAPPLAFRTDQPSPGLLRVLAELEAPAMITSDLSVTLRQNALNEALLGVQTNFEGLRRSLIYRWFTDPESRAIHPVEDQPRHAQTHVGALRTAHGRNPDDPEVRALVDALNAESPEFAALWACHDVAARAATNKRFVHPVVGLLHLDCQVLTAENLTERLVVFTARPGSEDAERLALLAVVGNQRLGVA